MSINGYTNPFFKKRVGKSCIMLIEQKLNAIKEITYVSVKMGAVHFEYQSDLIQLADIERTLFNIGFQVVEQCRITNC